MWPLTSVFVALFLIVLGATPVAAQTTVRTPVELMNAGAAALEARRFADALSAFQSAAKLQPANPSAWFGGGISAFMLGRSSDAEPLIARALELQPAFTEASLMLGDLQYRSGK